MNFNEAYSVWLQKQIEEEHSSRRREILSRGLSYSTVDFLRKIWFPAVGHFDHLFAEYEVRDLNNKIRYIVLAFMPNEEKGCNEIHDFRSHARDVDTERFKDLCMKQAILVLDGWDFLPIAYLSIRDNPEVCKQLVLALVGKYLSTAAPVELNWLEAEIVRFARRLVRPFNAPEVAKHLHISERHSRRLLKDLVEKKLLVVASGNQRFRTFQIRNER